MSTVIKVENLSKQYRLGNVGTGTISHDLNRFWQTTVRGKEDPYLKIGEENDRSTKGNSEYVWALKDINFEVKQGEVLGIIGKNGAGKSTLLKILSRTTTPTTGQVKLKGRIASLLEVGTGFHGELTGRENIFLNGSILGMTKQEIKSKLDEIIDFSAVERYIDTPVKRYSSGMYVRLGFAVAAYLDPDILIVDEVLAVGDAEFQKKAIGKMKDVSRSDGRTILFVSHNMIAVKSLCPRTIFMQNGMVKTIGTTEEVMNSYLSHDRNSTLRLAFDDQSQAPGNDKVRMKRIEICPIAKNINDPITITTPVNIEFEFWNFSDDITLNLSMPVNTLTDECVFVAASNLKTVGKGLVSAVCVIPGNFLNDGIYQVSMMIISNSTIVHNFENVVSFEVTENREATAWHGKWPGIVRPKLDFRLNEI